MDADARFFAPIGANEMFLSTLLGWALQTDDGAIRRLFLAAVAGASTGEPASAWAAALLGGAPDVRATVESYATVGNIDLALYSTQANVVLLVEHKTGTALSERQLTKYVRAMKAADPRGDRTVGVVLLRPDNAGDARDAAADPEGFGAAVRLTHADLAPVWAAIEARLDPATLGSHVLRAALTHARTGGERPVAIPPEPRRRLLERIAAAADRDRWVVEPVRGLAAVLHPRGLGQGHVRVTLGASSRSMLTVTLDRLRLAAPREDNHLLDLAPGATSFAIPTPFPCDHREKPWIGGEEADLADQVEVARRMLEALHPRLEPLSPVGGPSGGGRSRHSAQDTVASTTAQRQPP